MFIILRFAHFRLYTLHSITIIFILLGASKFVIITLIFSVLYATYYQFERSTYFGVRESIFRYDREKEMKRNTSSSVMQCGAQNVLSLKWGWSENSMQTPTLLGMTVHTTSFLGDGTHTHQTKKHNESYDLLSTHVLLLMFFPNSRLLKGILQLTQKVLSKDQRLLRQFNRKNFR